MFSESQDNWVKGQLGVGGTAAASVLLDYKSVNPITGEPYTQLQWSKANELKAKKDSNIILMKNVDGRMVPDLSEDQQAEAERVMKTQINIGLDYEEDIKAVKTGFEATPEPKDIRDGKKEIEKKQNLQKVWNQIKSQSAEDRIASFESLIGTEIAKSAGLIGVNPSEDGTSISFVYIDSQKAKNRTIDIDPNISDEEWAIIGNEITGLDDPTAAVAAGGFGKDKDGKPLAYNADFGTSGANREGNLQRFDAELSSFVDDGFPATAGGEPFLDLEQDEVVIALNDRYGKFGLKAVATGYGGADNTRVTIEGWTGDGVAEQSYDLDSDTDVDSTALEDQEAFKKWLKYVLEKTGQVERIAETEGFTGKKKTTTTKAEDDAAAAEAKKFGPCEGGKKIELATGLPINC